MIKLYLPDKPNELADNEAALTAVYKADRTKAVWRKDYIVNPLLEMSHNKCAYSEIRLQEESKYMEVEHFRHKDLYPDDVVKWGNLLPSCKACNVKKSKWDVESDPIVNPITDIPREHLYVKCCRFYPKDDKGQNTIDAVGLNDQDNFVIPRAKIAFGIAEALECAFESLQEADTLRKVNVRFNRIKDLLKQCDSTSPYSAVIATYLLYEWPKFHVLTDYLKSKNLWDEDCERIEDELTEIALPVG